jgi:hypothetical protein
MDPFIHLASCEREERRGDREEIRTMSREGRRE